MDKIPKLKVVVVGDAGVGKTCLVDKYIDKSFKEDTNQTVVAGSSEVRVLVNDKYVNLNIWDTAGQERYRSMTRQFYRDSNIAFICFDYNVDESVNNIDTWANDIRSYVPDCILYLVATKIDLIRNDDDKIAKENELDDFLERKLNDGFKETFKTSAMTNININELFEAAAKEIDNIEKPIEKQEEEIIDLNTSKKNSNNNDDGKCC